MIVNAFVRIGAATEKIAPYLGWSAGILIGLFIASRLVAQ